MSLPPVPVVGLDLSMTATGLATPTALRTLKTTGRADATLLEMRDRLVGLATTIGLCVAEAAVGYAGALVVIEAPSFGQQRQRGDHARAGLWWLVVDELLAAGHAVVDVTPAARAKYATGKGNAGKTAVASDAARRYDVAFADDNQADAFVLRAMGLHHLDCLLAPVPKTHAVALDAVRWPADERVEQLALTPGAVHVPGQLAIA